MSKRTKILIGILIVIILTVGGWWVWNIQTKKMDCSEIISMLNIEECLGERIKAIGILECERPNIPPKAGVHYLRFEDGTELRFLEEYPNCESYDGQKVKVSGEFYQCGTFDQCAGVGLINIESVNLISGIPKQIEIDLKSCSENNDCIKVLANPCTSATGICRATVINKRHKDYWNNLLNECENSGVKCEDTAPGNESFRMDPECIGGRCELTKQRPYTVTPQCGIATADHLIPFGWFPVDYESKHVIQIDNNQNFSSPEIEEYETSSGIFTPNTPLDDGTYYWRVKSTKLEKEKCIPPPCAPNTDDPNDPCSIAIKSYFECKEQYSKWSDVCSITIITIE